jgi:hypothetical protein
MKVKLKIKKFSAIKVILEIKNYKKKIINFFLEKFLIV